jgi:hypothetical protein
MGSASLCGRTQFAHKKHYVNFLDGEPEPRTKQALSCHLVVTLESRIHTSCMGKVIRFPLARRRADIERGARVFEALRDQDLAAVAAQRMAAGSLSIAAVLATVLHVVSLSA